jgi:hypothetical protein
MASNFTCLGSNRDLVHMIIYFSKNYIFQSTPQSLFFMFGSFSVTNGLTWEVHGGDTLLWEQWSLSCWINFIKFYYI